ncbi:MAG: cysteine desulfurase [Lachnospiraceae bacterium]|nr:cysteine desulfurase [Lachnospiraceae bacterium]
MIYLDNAATTRLDHQAAEYMTALLAEEYGNPSSAYALGRSAKNIVESARRSAADLFRCKENEIFFTSGGTEANNWAITGVSLQYWSEHRIKRGHIVSTAIEHQSVLNALKLFEREGGSYTLVKPDSMGRISPESIKKAIRKDTFLVSVISASNEIGTIQSIRELAEAAHENGCLFHTDGVQAAGHIPLSLPGGDVDLFSASAHKMYGPKGVGLLYIKDGVKIQPLLYGGMQERGRRAGTENVTAIAGFGTALESARMNMGDEIKRVAEMSDKLIELLSSIPGVEINGSGLEENEDMFDLFNSRLPGIVSATIDGVRAEALVIALDQKGVCASTGAACATGAALPSHVLTAIGKSKEEAENTIRFSIGKYNRMEEIEEAFGIIKECVHQIRQS